MATTSTNLSAAVTRILILTGFPKELKTKDIQTAFSDFEGFKIKWIDDTSLYVVFNDAVVGQHTSSRHLLTTCLPSLSEACLPPHHCLPADHLLLGGDGHERRYTPV
jgi:hypothetical protein